MGESRCLVLWCFRFVRAWNTSSRSRSVVNRTVTGLVRGRPFAPVLRPSRWLRSMSSRSTIKPMLSLITFNTNWSVSSSQARFPRLWRLVVVATARFERLTLLVGLIVLWGTIPVLACRVPHRRLRVQSV